MHALAADILARMEAHEAATRPRKRARKVADQETFGTLVNIVTANLALAVLDPPPSGVLAVRLGKLTRAATRYDHPAFGKQLAPMLELMHGSGFAVLDVSTRRGEVSNLAPTETFAGLVRASGATLRDLGRLPGEECLRVTRKIERSDGHTRERADYRDSETTHRMREELRQLNASLSTADVRFVPDGLLPEVNDRDRFLCRHFPMGADDMPRFDQGGRLFGGFWLNLPSGRRHALRIDGEPVADLDYQSMFVRLAYAHVGRTPPDGDLYALPGLEGHRSGVKLAMNTLFWDERRGRKNWPKEMGVGVGDDRAAQADPDSPAANFTGRLPPNWERVSRLTAAIREHHADLHPALGQGIGGRLMFRESEIMMAVLARLMNMGVVAMPLHDGLLVSRSKVAQARTVMEEVAEEMTGFAFPVTEKPITVPVSQ